MGNKKWSQVFSNVFARSTPTGKTQIGQPVLRANITGPGLATYRGPRGPSIVNPQSTPCSKRLAITARPRSPPREELPWAVPKPNHSITLRVHCPSNAVVFITTMPRLRPHHTIGIITRCQNAHMHLRPEAYTSLE